MNVGKTLVGIVSGLAVTLAVGAVVGNSVAAAPSTPPTPTPVSGGSPTSTFPVVAGHRYLVTLTATQPLSTPLTVAQVVAAFPGAVNVPPSGAPMPPGTTMNVLAAGYGSPPGLQTVGGSTPIVSYTFDLFVAPTNPPGAFTGAQLAAPYVGTIASGATTITGPGGVGITVALLDQGPTPQGSTQQGSGGGVGHVAPTPANWTRASVGTVVSPGDGVRISIASSDFATLAASLNLPTSAAGFQQLLGLPQFTAVLAPQQLNAWGPADTLPADWPADDPQPSGEYHAQFVFGGPSPVTVPSTWSIPVILWTRSGGVGTNISVVGVKQGNTGGAQTGGAGGASYPTTAPQTAHLTPPSPAGSVGQVPITGAAPGTPITIVIDGGGTFSYVNSTNVNAAAGGTEQTAGYPLQPPPSLPFFVYTTPAAAGTVDILWKDASGAAYHSQVSYGQ